MIFTEVENLILKKLPNAKIKVEDLTGTMDHLGILVIDDSFQGISLIEQHQMIMDALKESLQKNIHAVKIKTATTEQAKKRGYL